MRPSNLLIGIDPELFLYDPKEQVFRSVIGRVGGTKEKPLDIGNGCAVQEDNMAVEFNTPATSVQSTFTENISYVQGWLDGHLAGQGLQLAGNAVARFPLIDYDNEKAWEFGCDPDFNAVTGEENPKPKAADKYMRTAGGHLHFGYDNPDNITNRKLMLIADLVLGVPSVLLDKDTERRELYGKASAHRIKPYGAEYRTLSNFWVQSKELQEWAFTNSMRVFEMLDDFDKVMAGNTLVMATAAINNCDKKLASFLARRYSLDTLGE